jgi:hypothetical protein
VADRDRPALWPRVAACDECDATTNLHAESGRVGETFVQSSAPGRNSSRNISVRLLFRRCDHDACSRASPGSLRIFPRSVFACCCTVAVGAATRHVRGPRAPPPARVTTCRGPPSLSRLSGVRTSARARATSSPPAPKHIAATSDPHAGEARGSHAHAYEYVYRVGGRDDGVRRTAHARYRGPAAGRPSRDVYAKRPTAGWSRSPFAHVPVGSIY